MVTQRSRWDDTGTTIPAGEAKYSVDEQPVAEYDNKYNSDVALDITDTIDEIENLATGHDHDGVNSKTVNASDVVNTPAGDIVATDVQAAIDELDSDKSVITSSSYAGNNTANRAIAHGLGRVPKSVMFVRVGLAGGHTRLIQPGYIHYGDAALDDVRTVTTWDSTNFYVGNSGNYNHTANDNSYSYYWVAMG